MRIVIEKLKELSSRHLYKTKNIPINNEWDNALGEKNNLSLQNERYDSTYVMESETEDDIPTQTLIHGTFTDSQRGS